MKALVKETKVSSVGQQRTKAWNKSKVYEMNEREKILEARK